MKRRYKARKRYEEGLFDETQGEIESKQRKEMTYQEELSREFKRIDYLQDDIDFHNFHGKIY